MISQNFLTKLKILVFIFNGSNIVTICYLRFLKRLLSTTDLGIQRIDEGDFFHSLCNQVQPTLLRE